ncbi:hypothetical protein Emag_003798 [Eimeria magna]
MKTAKASKRPRQRASASSAEGGEGSPAVSASSHKAADKKGVKHAIKKKQPRRDSVKKATSTISPGAAEAVGHEERTSKSKLAKTRKAAKAVKEPKKKRGSIGKTLETDAVKSEGADDCAGIKRKAGVFLKRRRTMRSAAKGKGEKLSRRQKRELAKRGIIYIGHLPLGFMEPQLRAFFSQFGEVTRVRLFRSRKTAHSKGYGFVEFALREVAAVAAQAMHKYRMFGRTLVCSLKDKDQVSDRVFRKTHKPFRRIDWQARAAALHNKPEGQRPSARGIRALQGRLKKKAKVLEGLGIDFDVPLLHADTSKEKTNFSAWLKLERSQKTKAEEAAKRTKEKTLGAVDTPEK